MKDDRGQVWETLTSEEVFAAEPWLRLTVEQVRLPDGRIVEDFYQIRLPDYVVVVAETVDGHLVMQRQYKHGIRRISLALPSGFIEGDEKPLEAAQRELLEETGYTSTDWLSLGCFVVDGNRGCGNAHLFLARNARLVAVPEPDDLEDIEVVLMNPREVMEAIRDGDVPQLCAAAAVSLVINCGPLAHLSE